MILFITANDNEQAVFLAQLEHRTTKTFSKGVVCNFGDFGKCKVAHYHSPDQGEKAKIKILRAIEAVTPRFVILVGIACSGMDENQQIGQVLVSKRILDYNERKEDFYTASGGEKVNNTILRGDIIPCGDTLCGLFFGHLYNWKKENNIDVHFGEIISSGFLSNNPEVKKEVFALSDRKIGRKAIGYEMEGAPAFQACRNCEITELIIVKGISDFGDGTKNKKSDEQQKEDQILAAKNAVSLCHYVFSQDGVAPIFDEHKGETEEKHILTEKNHQYYNAWLNSQTNNISRSLYTDLPITGCYDEVISQLREKFTGSTWKQDIIKVISDEIKRIEDEIEESSDEIKRIECKKDLTQLKTTVDQIKGHIDYEMIWEVLKKIWEILKKNFSKSQLESKFVRDFNKIAIISGEPGAGKSHFLNDFFRFHSPSDDSDIVFVPLNCDDIIKEAPVTSASWETLLVRGFNYCFKSTLPNFESLSCNINFRLIFVIDNIHRLYLHRADSFKQLLLALKDNTKYDFVFWLFTINQFDLYLLENKHCILQDYIIKNEKDYGLFKSTFNLTCYNEDNAIGKKILSLYSIESSPFSCNAEFLTNTLKTGLCAPINNPFYAHIIGKSGTTELLPCMTEYFDFIEGLVRCLDSRLKSVDESHYSSILSSVNSIANMSLHESKIVFTESKLNHIVERNSVTVLREYGLLQRIGENNNVYSLQNLEEMYGLYVNVYWVLKIVLSAHKTADSSNSAYSSMARIVEYRDTLIPFYLLFLDNNGLLDESSELLNDLKRDDNFKYALFASVKSSVSYRTILLKFLLKDENVLLGNAETFAMLCYLYYHNATAHDKYYILNKYIDSIFKHGLQDNIVIILSQLLNNAKNSANLKKNIKPLFGCKIPDACFLFGYQIGSKFYDLIINEPLEKQINDIIYYLIENYKAINTPHEPPKDTFIDFFIRAYFQKLITNQKIGVIKLYITLKNQGVFHDKRIELLIRRNFSCAAGNIYERAYSQEYKDEYYDLVDMLIDNGSIEDFKFAFHFISNSINNEYGTSCKIDCKLQPFLKIIWNDNRLYEFCKKRQDFFLRNLVK